MINGYKVFDDEIISHGYNSARLTGGKLSAVYNSMKHNVPALEITCLLKILQLRIHGKERSHLINHITHRSP